MGFEWWNRLPSGGFVLTGGWIWWNRNCGNQCWHTHRRTGPDVNLENQTPQSWLDAVNSDEAIKREEPS